MSAAWHPADGPAIVIGHGAGAGMDHPFLVGFAEAVAAEGVAALRFNFPYLEAGRRSPDSPANAIAASRAAFAATVERAAGRPVFAGGKSYGGRIASMAAAEGMPAAGLVFLGYPLHPPGRPEQVRDAHLVDLDLPMLFLQGTKDPFADPATLRATLRKLGDRATYVPFEGAGHSLERSRKDDPRANGASAAPFAVAFVREHA
ncbi:MAG TPA: alpha/beta family hydrolase [Actinomycetota bacterium]|nr:alpha/beta family hydrolase [Actinomycetota bacterium]